MDDIAIPTKNLSLSLHKVVVSDILQVAKDNSLFFKLSKSVFHTLSHQLPGSNIRERKDKDGPSESIWGS